MVENNALIKSVPPTASFVVRLYSLRQNNNDNQKCPFPYTTRWLSFYIKHTTLSQTTMTINPQHSTLFVVIIVQHNDDDKQQTSVVGFV